MRTRFSGIFFLLLALSSSPAAASGTVILGRGYVGLEPFRLPYFNLREQDYGKLLALKSGRPGRDEPYYSDERRKEQVSIWKMAGPHLQLNA